MNTLGAVFLILRSGRKWWQDAVTSQVYVCCFANANGDRQYDV